MIELQYFSFRNIFEQNVAFHNVWLIGSLLPQISNNMQVMKSSVTVFFCHVTCCVDALLLKEAVLHAGKRVVC